MEKIGDQYEKTFLNASAGVLDALARLFGQVGGVERAALLALFRIAHPERSQIAGQ